MRETPTEAQGKTTNPMDNQQETKEKILRVMTRALSVLSYPPAQSNSYAKADFNLMPLA